MQKELVDYALLTYRYKDALAFAKKLYEQNPSDENLEILMQIYKELGKPQKTLPLLERKFAKKGDIDSIEEALGIAIEVGELQKAKKYVDVLMQNKKLAFRASLYIARYFYINKEIEKASDVLQRVKEPKEEEKKSKEYLEYLHLKSDLAWYTQNIQKAAKASLLAIELGGGRVEDFERAIYFYQKKDPSLTTSLAKEGYERFRLSYLFYTYANTALQNGNHKELVSFFGTLDEQNSPLANDALYWLIKAQTYNALGKSTEAMAYMEKAFELNGSDDAIRIAMIWFLADFKQNGKLKELLFSIEEGEVGERFYFPLASAYLFFRCSFHARISRQG